MEIFKIPNFLERLGQKFKILMKISICDRYWSDRYWSRFMKRKQLCFSDRKSDAVPFTEAELEQFRKEMEVKLMFYKKDDICNVDESGWFYREIIGNQKIQWFRIGEAIGLRWGKNARRCKWASGGTWTIRKWTLDLYLLFKMMYFDNVFLK